VTEATADLDLVQRILRETGVDQSVPTAGLAGYAQALAEAAMDWLKGHAPHVGDLFAGLAGLAPMATLTAGGLVLLALLVVAAKALLARRRRISGAPALPAPFVPARFESNRGRVAWQLELERCLAAGDVTGGLEALWWWFASSVATVRVDPSWTSLELLVRCQRTDLTPFARSLDRLLYGGVRPGIDDLRRFTERLGSVLR
jgi:hypothetical protein